MEQSSSSQISTARRREKDLLGEAWVPAEAYYGIQTQRARENFDLSGVRLSLFPQLIKALALVKMACAKANNRLGLPAGCFSTAATMISSSST